MYRFTYPRENFDETSIDKKKIFELINEHRKFSEKFEQNEKYYNGQHSIENRVKKNKKMANNKIVCNHARYIADIAVGYFMGNAITYTIDRGDLDKLTDELDYANADNADSENALNMSKFGVSYEYIFADEGETRLKIKTLSPKNVFIVYDDSIEEKELFAVYYYIKKDDANKKVKYMAAVFTENYITEYCFFNGEKYTEKAPERHYFGEIPIVEYLNNIDGIGDFEQQISLIDAYNKLTSDRLNDKEQFLDAVLVLYGAILGDDEDTAGGAKKRLKESGLLEMPPDGKVEYLVNSLDENGVEVLRKAIEEDIHKFSYVPCLSDENFAGNASGVAMEYKLLGLEMITKIKTRFYRNGLRKRIRLFCNYPARAMDIDYESVVPVFSRGMPKNLVEIAQMITNLKDTVSQETLISQVPFVEDAASEIEKLNKERESYYGGLMTEKDNEPLDGDSNE